MSLSERIRAAMTVAGISQTELARACNVKPPSVHGWLTGKAKFLRGENLLLAARALGVSQDWLATGKGEMRQAAEAAPDQGKVVEQDWMGPELADWISLRQDLGSDDIAEFTALIRARQEKNRKLMDELRNGLDSGKKRSRHSQVEPWEDHGNKKQSLQSTS